MDWLDFLFILSAYVFAAVIKGLTGIGFSTSCLPILALRIDLTAAIPLVIVPSMAGNVVVIGKLQQKLSATWHRRLVLVFLLIMGLILLTRILR